MADIALLIVEDYESRTTRSIEKAGGNQGDQNLNLISNFASRLSHQKLHDFLPSIRKVQEKFDLAKEALNPKSELGLAAINGFFSA